MIFTRLYSADEIYENIDPNFTKIRWQICNWIL